MAKKNRGDKNGYVYSTDPDFRFEQEEHLAETPVPAQQQLRVWLETRNRGGRPATVVRGFRGRHEDLEILGKQLKNHCGTGGSVKEGEIIIQGDQRQKILLWLSKNGFVNSKPAGG